MYRFSRIWGTITAGLGWLILVGTPVVFAVGATTKSQRVAQLAQVWRGATTPWLLANPALFVRAVALLGSRRPCSSGSTRSRRSWPTGPKRKAGGSAPWRASDECRDRAAA
jgi:hypothetical protein